MAYLKFALPTQTKFRPTYTTSVSISKFYMPLDWLTQMKIHRTVPKQHTTVELTRATPRTKTAGIRHQTAFELEMEVCEDIRTSMAVVDWRRKVCAGDGSRQLVNVGDERQRPVYPGEGCPMTAWTVGGVHGKWKRRRRVVTSTVGNGCRAPAADADSVSPLVTVDARRQ